jgi:hypothetical protein
MVKAVAIMKRILALAMPLCLLWAMVGCVLVCASHIEETLHQEDSSSSDHQVTTSMEDDCCPIEDSVGVRPERPLEALEDGNAAPIQANPFAFERNVLSSEVQSRTFIPAFSPPFARLCTLRI